jgi:iron complex outermembrane receptor protein
MAELFTSTNAAGIVVVPNPELQAESGWSAELGVKQLLKIGENWKGIFDVAGFINSYDNMTEFTFFSWPEGLGFKSVNVGKTQVTGIELTLTGNGKIGDVDLRFLTGYAFMNPIILNPDEPYAYGTSGTEITYANTSSDNSNNILKYRYQNLFKLDLQTEYKGFGLGLSTKYNDYMQNIDLYFELGAISGLKESRALNPNGEVIFDARVYYEFSKTFRLSFIVDNLTNLEYTPRPGMLAAPRMFTFKATYRTGG